jgi:hypothetical protein
MSTPKMQKYDEKVVNNKTGCLPRCNSVDYGSKLTYEGVRNYRSSKLGKQLFVLNLKTIMIQVQSPLLVSYNQSK